MIDLAVQFDWKRLFFKDKFGLDIHLGYEFHVMPDFIQFLYLIHEQDESFTRATPHQSNFTLQGLTFGMDFSF